MESSLQITIQALFQNSTILQRKYFGQAGIDVVLSPIPSNYLAFCAAKTCQISTLQNDTGQLLFLSVIFYLKISFVNTGSDPTRHCRLVVRLPSKNGISQGLCDRIPLPTVFKIPLHCKMFASVSTESIAETKRRWAVIYVTETVKDYFQFKIFSLAAPIRTGL